MKPLDAVNQIAFRLERNGADTSEVQAFPSRPGRSRTCPTSSRPWPDPGWLQGIEGVGKSTAQVIAEALEGKVRPPTSKRSTKTSPRTTSSFEGAAGRGAARCVSAATAIRTRTGPTAAAPLREMAEAARDLGASTWS